MKEIYATIPMAEYKEMMRSLEYVDKKTCHVKIHINDHACIVKNAETTDEVLKEIVKYIDDNETLSRDADFYCERLNAFRLSFFGRLYELFGGKLY